MWIAPSLEAVVNATFLMRQSELITLSWLVIVKHLDSLRSYLAGFDQLYYQVTNRPRDDPGLKARARVLQGSILWHSSRQMSCFYLVWARMTWGQTGPRWNFQIVVGGLLNAKGKSRIRATRHWRGLSNSNRRPCFRTTLSAVVHL